MRVVSRRTTLMTLFCYDIVSFTLDTSQQRSCGVYTPLVELMFVQLRLPRGYAWTIKKLTLQSINIYLSRKSNNITIYKFQASGLRLPEKLYAYAYSCLIYSIRVILVTAYY